MKTEQLITCSNPIPEFPDYRITPEGVIWSNRKRKRTAKNTDFWKPLKHVVDSGTGYPLVTLVDDSIKVNKYIHSAGGFKWAYR